MVAVAMVPKMVALTIVKGTLVASCQKSSTVLKMRVQIAVVKILCELQLLQIFQNITPDRYLIHAVHDRPSRAASTCTREVL